MAEPLHYPLSSPLNNQYRADIDGLRAIAVVSVIIFHINADYLPGGFLGVDIFFVISGYLITLLLVKEITITGRLSIIDFYRRRIQRLFPALLFMLITTLLLGFLLLVPKDYTALLKSTSWSLFSAANIYFFTAIKTDYFAADSEELPLLHLWSLGVEEQFYIIWPLLILALIKLIPTIAFRLTILGIVFISSLLIMQYLLPDHQHFVFYMLPTRAWELVAGSIVAFINFSSIKFNKLWQEFFASLGIIAIVSSLALISKNDFSTGVHTVYVVLGSAFLLLPTDKTHVSRVLSLSPLVSIGLVSYSAYLWHWPILAFLRYTLIEINLLIGIGVLLTTFIMAYLGYFYIEYPLRKYKTSSRNIFVWYFSVPVFVIYILSISIIKFIEIKSQWIYNWNQYSSVAAIDTRAATAYSYNCQYHGNSFDVKSLAQERCVFPENSQPTVLLVGDSNAAHYLGMLRVFSKYYNFSIRNITKSACPLIFGTDKLNWMLKTVYHGCETYRSAMQTEVSKYETVIIGGSWNIYDKYGRNDFRLKFENTLSTLASQAKTVIILAKVPIFNRYNQECQLRSIKMPFIKCEKPYHIDDVDVQTINKFLDNLSKKYPNVYFFDIRNQLCAEQLCSPYLNHHPVYFNVSHLSMVGSEMLGKNMLQNHAPSLAIFEKIGNHF